MIEVRHLTAGYPGNPVLQDITLQFLPGQVTALLGPNGCGKSTLLKTALGLVPALAGEVLYDGAPLHTLAPVQIAQKSAYMAQSRNVPNLRARQLVLHGRFPHLTFPRRYRPEDHAAVERALQQADAWELADCRLPELSGGQRQKVYLAMALAQDTPTLFMDEPTAYLDVRHQLEVYRTVRKLADEGRAVVLVCHDITPALRTADCVAVLARHTLLYAGTPEGAFVSGALEDAFGVKLQRLWDGASWQYYFPLEK